MRRRMRVGPWYRLAVLLLKPPAWLLTRPTWTGRENVPAGGLIVAANHISLADPVVLADFLLHGTGLVPRFMAKAELFRGRGLVAHVMRGAGQIPVDRHGTDASAALDVAVAALQAGECVTIYPEGTVTTDPGGWPMRARTGVARLALLSGAPVLPVTQWGAREVLHRQTASSWLRRTPVQVHVGAPVDLSPWRGRPLSGPVLREATNAVMDRLTGKLEALRGAPRPAVVHDPRAAADRPAPGTESA